MSKSFSPTLSRLWRLIKGFLTSNERWKAFSLLLLILLFAFGIAFINVQISYINRDLFNAISRKDQGEFIRKLSQLLLGFVIATPVIVLSSYIADRLKLLWRKWLSREILSRYFSQLSFYRITWQEGIDNPDQRIEEDIRTLTSLIIDLFIQVVNSTLTLVLFVNILWSISSTLIFAVITYAAVGSFLTFLIGRKLFSLNFVQLKKEADYRYKLVNVRDNAEPISFLGGAGKEYIRTRQKLKSALKNFLKIINLNMQLGLFVNIYNYLKPVLPIIIVTPLFMRGDLEIGQIPQAADAFVRVVEALSVIIQHFGTISSVAAVVTRLGSFSEALNHAAEETSCYFPRIQYKTSPSLSFKSVTITTPHGEQTLARDLNFTHEQGGLLITGPSGTGKTSIFRSISGLWVFGGGEISKPAPEHSMFIPQRPYLVIGTLRNQLLYGNNRSGYTDKELLEALRLVGLIGILKRSKGLDKVCDWGSMLSAGEQQQLSFARFILREPDYLFLDEATTAVDSETEKRTYELVSDRTKAWISIGYRESLMKYHTRMLELKPDGSYILTEIAATEFNTINIKGVE